MKTAYATQWHRLRRLGAVVKRLWPLAMACKMARDFSLSAMSECLFLD